MYEVTLDRTTEVRPAEDDGGISAHGQFDFCKFAAMADKEDKTVVDVCGIVKAFDEPTTIISQKQGGKEIFKREITLVSGGARRGPRRGGGAAAAATLAALPLPPAHPSLPQIDDSAAEIRMTLWGEQATADSSTFEGNPVVCMRGCRVSDYGGRSLGSGRGKLLFNPAGIPEAAAQQQWWAAGGADQAATKLTGAGGGGRQGLNEKDKASAVPLSSIKDQNLGSASDAYITCMATLNWMKDAEMPW